MAPIIAARVVPDVPLEAQDSLRGATRASIHQHLVLDVEPSERQDHHNRTRTAREHAFVQSSFTSTIYKVSDNAFEVAFATVLIIVSFPILWFNERRAARMQSLVAFGETEYVSVREALPENQGQLVYASMGEAHAKEPIADDMFQNVELNCLVLKTTIEVFQWVEYGTAKVQSDFRGSTSNFTRFNYRPEWSTVMHDSKEFHNQDKQNVFHITPGVHTKICSRVEYGEHNEGGFQGHFIVPEDLVSQMTNLKSAHDQLSDKIIFKSSDSGVTIECAKTVWPLRKAAKDVEDSEPRGPSTPSGSEYFVYGSGSEIGDIRVQIQYIADGPMTIMALQAPPEKDGEKDVFAPFRLVSRWSSKDVQKERLIEESKKTPAELAEADKCLCGPLDSGCGFCIFLCDWVNSLFAGGDLYPQIYSMFVGPKTPEECVADLRARSVFMSWAIRLLGFTLMYVGTYVFFAPILTFMDLTPLLAPYTFLQGDIIFVFSALSSLFLATLVVSVAFVCYRPLVSLWYLLLAVAMGGAALCLVA